MSVLENTSESRFLRRTYRSSVQISIVTERYFRKNCMEGLVRQISRSIMILALNPLWRRILRTSATAQPQTAHTPSNGMTLKALTSLALFVMRITASTVVWAITRTCPVKSSRGRMTLKKTRRLSSILLEGPSTRCVPNASSGCQELQAVTV